MRKADEQKTRVKFSMQSVKELYRDKEKDKGTQPRGEGKGTFQFPLPKTQ